MFPWKLSNLFFLQRRAGLKCMGEGDYVQLPLAWTELLLLGVCLGKIQNGGHDKKKKLFLVVSFWISTPCHVMEWQCQRLTRDISLSFSPVRFFGFVADVPRSRPSTSTTHPFSVLPGRVCSILGLFRHGPEAQPLHLWGEDAQGTVARWRACIVTGENRMWESMFIFIPGRSVSNVFDFYLSKVLHGVRFGILLGCRPLLIGCGRTCFLFSFS